MALTIVVDNSCQPKTGNVFHLLRPISSLSTVLSSSGSHLHLSYNTLSTVEVPTGGG